MPQSPDRTDPAAGAKAAANSDSAAAAARIWDKINRTIAQAIKEASRRPQVDVDSVNYPLAGAAGGTAGLLVSVIIGFPSRILGWSMESVHGGTITLDVRRSTPATHPSMVSLCGSSYYPNLSGFYVPFTDAAPWPSTELAVGEILHIYCMSSDSGWVDGTLELRIRRLDVPPA